MSCHLSIPLPLLSLQPTPLQPHWSPRCFMDVPSTFSALGLCTCHPPCLEISSSRPVVLKQGTSQRILSGDIFSCYSWIEDATGIWWVEATDAAKHPVMHRKVPHNRVIPSKNFPGGPVVKNPLANAGDTGLIPGPGRSHLPRGD